MIEVKVENIRVSLMSQQHVVILKDLESSRYLAVWIGRYEAEAIRLALDGEVPPRPLTHDLALKIVEELSATITRVIISDLYQDTFYARVEVAAPDGRKLSIDSRSSDAIALAVRAKCQIFVDDDVMDKAGVVPDESEEAAGEGGEEDLGAFSDFINSLNLDDLDKEK